ncbi:MAG: hypothetical protein II480_02075, partial [Bacteroidales bacterium]|nr:hypothetical protein [Bacteroidales bacterium]
MNTKTTILALLAVMLLTVQAAFGQGLTPSNWRNEQTGDWVIGFYDDFAIYDCKFWNYKQKTQSGDTYNIVLDSDGKEISVTVNNLLGNRRDIVIDGQRATYSVINGNTLPDYPTKDTRTGFKDSHYNTDTVTLVGWLKDMPKKAKRMGNEFEVTYNDIFTNKSASAYGKMDELGRFEVKIPLLNSSEVFCDWKRIHLNSLFEPGETYFLFCDFATGQRLFMGKNCRLQNELLSYPKVWIHERLDGDNDDAAALKSFEKLKKEKADAMSDLEQRVAAHPTLSQRYIDYLTGMYDANALFNLMQGRFVVKNRQLPKEIIDYATQYWHNSKRQYTLYQDFGSFMRNFMEHHIRERYVGVMREDRFRDYVEEVYPQILRLHRDKGKVTITDEELKMLEDYARCERVRDANNTYDTTLGPTYQQFRPIIERDDIKTLLDSQLPSLFKTLNVLDEVGCDAELRDIIITNHLYNEIDHSREPLSKVVMDYFEEIVSMPPAKEFLRAEQAKYVAINNNDIDGNPSLKLSDGLAGMSDGEQLLHKITEPYRGKLVLLDVWGTWCAPCKEL